MVVLLTRLLINKLNIFYVIRGLKKEKKRYVKKFNLVIVVVVGKV